MTEAHAGGRSWWGMRGRAPILGCWWAPVQASRPGPAEAGRGCLPDKAAQITITNAMVFMLVFSCNLRLFGAIWAL